MRRSERTAELLDWTEHRRARGLTIERRTMAEARREDGQRMLALNEIFVGHASHQSARYRLSMADGQQERQSSSGLIVAVPTGHSTGAVR